MPSRSARVLRRLLLGLLPVPLVALAALTVVWWVATSRLEAGVEEWLAGARANGWAVEFREPQRSGWPLAARVTLRRFSVVASEPDVPVPISWRADRLILSIALRRPQELAIEGEGPERVGLGEGAEIPFIGDSVRLVIPLRAAQRQAVLTAANLHVGAPGAAGTLVGHLRLFGRVEAEGGYGFDAEATSLTLPASYPWLFGPNLAAFSAAGVVLGRLPAVGPAIGATQAVSAWRDGGGTIDVRRVALTWGQLTLDGKAALALDRNLQPIGTATLDVVDYPRVLDALAAAGRITPSAALAAKAVLGLMAHASDQQGRTVAELPLKLQDQTLTLGRIPLSHLPTIAWP